MVAEAQFLERPAVIACGEIALDGLFYRGSEAPAVLICPPISSGGGMDAPVVAELAWACARAGHPSLRFQHRGVGGSTGSLDPSAGLEDALAALAHLAESGGVERLAAAGVGTGCATAAALARANAAVEMVALVAPASDLQLAGLTARLLVLLPEKGAAAAPALDVRADRKARIEMVPGADPLFRRGLPALARATVAFFQGR